MKWLGTLIYLAGIFSLVGAAIFSPAHPWDSALYAALVTSPGWLLVWYLSRGWLAQLRASAANQPKKVRDQMSFISYVFPFALAGICILLFFLDNRFEDKSTPVAVTVPIVSAYMRTHKGSRSYFVDIESQIPKPLPFEIIHLDSIRLRSQDYNQARSSQSIEFYKHAGALGLPWIEDYRYRLIGVLLPTEIREACAYKPVIHVVQPESYTDEKWPDGSLKSHEPLVNGVKNGMARYTFPSGKVYGEIPWVDGKKDGVFTLYREDGSKEQTLSYKAGHLFGVSEWFDRGGTTTHRQVYVDDKKVYDASVCN